MFKTVLFLLLALVAAGCRRHHFGDILHADPHADFVVAVRPVAQTMYNELGLSADELTMDFIESYNAQNDTNFTYFISTTPIDISRLKVAFNGTLIEIR